MNAKLDKIVNGTLISSIIIIPCLAVPSLGALVLVSIASAYVLHLIFDRNN